MVNVPGDIPQPRSVPPQESMPYEIRWPETATALELSAQIYSSYQRLGGAPRRISSTVLPDGSLLLAYRERLLIPVVIRDRFVPSTVSIIAQFGPPEQAATNPETRLNGPLAAVIVEFFVPTDTQPTSRSVITSCDPESDGAGLDFVQLMDLLGIQGRQEILMGLGTINNIFNAYAPASPSESAEAAQ